MASFLWDEPLSPENAGELTAITRSIVKATRSYQPGALASEEFSQKGPITIAIYGPWGSGKTSVLRSLQNHYDAPKDNSASAVTVWFEPWRYEKEENLIVPLLTELTSAITQQLRSDKAKQAAVKTSMKLLGRVAKATARTAAGFISQQIGVKSDTIEALGKEFLTFYEDESKRYSYPVSENEAFKNDFQELIRIAGSGTITQKQNKPICIFIDDLDRCSSKQVQRLLESMKNFLWADGVTYVLALDREQVTMALAEQHIGMFESLGNNALLQARVRAKNYMEKFFLYSFSLSSGASHYERTVVSKARDSFFDELKQKLDDTVSPTDVNWATLQLIFNQTGINLRRIKRVLRWLYYELHMETIDPKVNAHFSELIFSENYSVIWLSSLSDASVPLRTNFYRRIVGTLSIFSDPDSDEWSVVPQQREEMLEIFSGENNTQPDNLDDETASLVASIRKTNIGIFIQQLLEGGDDDELQRLYLLSSFASEL